MDFTKSTPQEVVVSIKEKLPAYDLPATIVSMDEYVLATELGSKISSARKDIEKFRDHFSKPHYETYKRIREQFAPFIDDLEGKEKTLKKMMLAFHAEEQKRLDAEQARIEAEALAAAPDGAEVTVPVVNNIKTVESLAGKSQVRAITKWKVTDITIVPAEFMMVNDKAIDEAVKKGIVPPGIEVYKENTLAYSR